MSRANPAPKLIWRSRRSKPWSKNQKSGIIYTGTVKRVENYGAFVEFLPGTEGMVHVSQLADYHVKSVEEEVSVGDEIMVMVINIDGTGRVRLSRQAVLEGWDVEEAKRRDAAGSRGGGPRRGGGDQTRRTARWRPRRRSPWRQPAQLSADQRHYQNVLHRRRSAFSDCPPRDPYDTRAVNPPPTQNTLHPALFSSPSLKPRGGGRGWGWLPATPRSKRYAQQQ